MKKLILAILATAAITGAKAQEGSILLYGNAGFDVATSSSNSVTRTCTVNPGIGYQFDEHLTAGIQGGYGVLKQDMPGLQELKSNTWQAGAFFRYTHAINKTFSFWGQVNAGYLAGKSENMTFDPIMGNITVKDDFNGFSAEIIPAVMINVYKGLALNFNIGGLGYRTISTASGADRSSFGVTFGQQMNFGISKNFTCHKRRSGAEPGMDTRRMRDMKDDE